MCLRAIPSFSYLAKSFLKLGLVLLLEEFPELLGVPVRPVLEPVRPIKPVRPPLGPIRPVDLQSVFVFLSCPPEC